MQTHREEISVIHVPRDSIASHLNWREMNLLDTASVQEVITVQREQVLIGVLAQPGHTATGLGCTWKSNAWTVILVNTVMDGILHLQQTSAHLVIIAP